MDNILKALVILILHGSHVSEANNVPLFPLSDKQLAKHTKVALENVRFISYITHTGCTWDLYVYD